MVAKDYPYYLVVKRMNCSLEVQTVSRNIHPAKEVEVGSLICDIIYRLHSIVAVCTR